MTTPQQPDDGGAGKPSDTDLLNWLDSQTTGYGDGIIFRMSTTGRGWRLHETSRETDPFSDRTPKPTVREAIASAMLSARTPTHPPQEPKS